MSSVVPIPQRPQKDTLVLFDVDETLTKAMQRITPDMIQVLTDLRKKAVVGFVGGSDLKKITGQLLISGDNVLNDFDYCFAENGLVAYKAGRMISSQSFIAYLGEEKYKKLVKYILHYIADLDIPIKRGTFVEFRNGMINVSPIGRNASNQERADFNEYDKTANVRKTMVKALQKEFADFGLSMSIGGMISFDVFPHGWNKTYCLQHVEQEHFKEIHFFGDKTFEGGNDFEIYSDPRTIGHSVDGPEDTLRQLKELFKL